MELYISEDGRYKFSKEEKVIVPVHDVHKEHRMQMLQLLDKILPSLEKVDRLIRDVGAEVTNRCILFSFKIRSRFYQALVPLSECKDESSMKRKFTYILKRELRDLQWVR